MDREKDKVGLAHLVWDPREVGARVSGRPAEGSAGAPSPNVSLRVFRGKASNLFINCHSNVKNNRSKNDIQIHRPPSDYKHCKHCSEPKMHHRPCPSLTGGGQIFVVDNRKVVALITTGPVHQNNIHRRRTKT